MLVYLAVLVDHSIQREAAFREKVTRINFKKKARSREALATPELVERFNFNVARREWIDGRSTLVMTFAAKATAPEDSIEDKIYKHVFGTVWVDEEEAELTKLDASVRGPIPLGAEYLALRRPEAGGVPARIGTSEGLSAARSPGNRGP